MTKNDKTAIFFINMRITAKYIIGQLSFLICLFLLSACSANREEPPVIPPLTSPLSRDYIGFGVITASFTHITSDPSDNSPSLGYLRRGTLVRIIRRHINRTNDGFFSWVLIDGEQQGWLREDIMDIYYNESQARTASEFISR